MPEVPQTEFVNMTNNPIDLASISRNLTNPSDTGGPEDIGVCRREPPFGKSWEEAVRSSTIAFDTVNEDAYQDLPLGRQDLPSEGAFGFGLEGVQEVRALVDAMFGNTRNAAKESNEPLMSVDTSFEAPVPRAGTFASPLVAGPYLHVDPKFQIQQFQDVLAVMTKETSAVETDAFLAVGSKKTGENHQSHMENQVGISPASQVSSKPVVHSNSIQIGQLPLVGKAPDVVSSTELATHLRVLRSSGGGEAQLQLHPAELGRMTVSLTTEGNEARVAFIVDNPQAKQAVEATLSRLRDLMEGAGLDLADADVSQRNPEEHESQSDGDISEDRVVNSSEVGDVFDQSNAVTSAHLIDAFA